MFKFRGLHARLLFMMALAVVPAVLVALYHISEENRRETSETEDRVVLLARLVSVEEERSLEESRRFLGALSRLPALRNPKSPECAELLRDLLIQYPCYANLGVIDTSGVLVCSGLPAPGSLQLGDRDYFRRALSSGDFSVGGYQVGRVTGLPSVNLGYPVRDASGRIAAVAFAALDLANLGDIESVVFDQLPPGSAVTKVDSAGVVLARIPDGEEWVGKRLSEMENRDYLFDGESGIVVGRPPGGGPKALLASARVGGSLWNSGVRVLLEVPTAEAFSEQNRVLHEGLIALALFAAIAFAGTRLVGNRLVLRPLRRLTDAAHRLQQGELGARIGSPYGSGEVGDLGRAFDRMSAALLERQEERDRADAALRRSEAEHRALVDRAPLGIFRTDLQGRFLAVNPALVGMLGYDSREDLANRNIREVYRHPREREKVLTTYSGNGDRAIGVDLEWVHRSGRSVWVRASGSMTRADDGTPLFLEVFVEDVTERRAMESHLQQARRMEVVGRLAGGVAHDFNNLLTVIQGCGQLALMDRNLTEIVRGRIHEIIKASQRAARLTRQLLAFSRRQILEPRSVLLNTTISDMGRMLSRLIREDIEMKEKLQTDLGTVRIDPGQLEQVILNLVVNARDAMPEGGILTLETANRDLSEPLVREGVTMPAGRYVVLTIGDTGQGMDAEIRSHVFEPFFTTKSDGKGTGLGLATVYGIVKQTGGYIWVDSEPGRGSTFTIYLPRIEEPEDRAAPETPGPDRGSETVLVVEDDPAVLDLTSRFLEAFGYTVLSANDSTRALERVSGFAGRIHLLLSDVVMPDMSGVELAKRVAAARPGIRILFMSGHSEELISCHGVLREGVNLIEKPFTREALASKIREVLAAAA